MEACFECRGLSKRFGNVQALDEVNISIMPGRVVGLLGPNGSGKTTLIKLANGLLTPDSGSGTCLGCDIRRESAQIKRQTGYMTQKFLLYSDLSIEENLAFVAALYELSPVRDHVRDTLADPDAS